MNRFIFTVFLLVGGTWAMAQALNIIPLPVAAKRLTGDFKLSASTVIVVADEADKKAAHFFNNYLDSVYGFTLGMRKTGAKNAIRLSTLPSSGGEKDGYDLQVSNASITIKGNSYAGTFYGMQTLIQLLEPYDFTSIIRKGSGISVSSLLIPSVSIQDFPRFAYRGMHLDVSRHFFSVGFIKKYIDYLALHKMNYFHWHLTDDQGWRIQVDKFPLLTTIGAYRNGSIIGRYPGTANDETSYGGFYSKSDVRAVIQYAADRHITVIPEIEMPGHASAAIAAYPLLSCFPEQKTDIPNHPSRRSVNAQATGTAKLVQETWGVFNDVFCAGKEETFTFLEGVLDEVANLFPSRYIHVGGDESPKVHWKRCPRCQKRMKDEGLKDEHELQSYFVQRIERYLGKKGKIIIGWDEILEGGLAPNAVVMSWQGEKGGIEAARQEHNVIMTPQVPVYFDHTQTKHEDSLTIGGFNPIEKVYAYDPVPAELTTNEARYILGAQANLWTEYITNGSKVEYMLLPRLSALSEVLWSPKASRNFASFEKRLLVQFNRYALWNAHPSRAYFDLSTNIGPGKGKGGVWWSLTNRSPNAQIMVSLPSGVTRTFDGDSVEVPIDIAGVYAAWSAKKTQAKGSSGNTRLSKTIRQQFSISKGTGKKITIGSQPNPKYAGQNGAFSIVNGVWSNRGLSAPDWLAWIGEDLEAVIDLGKREEISTVRMHTIDQKNSWVYLPKWIEVSVSSDGKTFSPAGKTTAFVVDSLSSGWMSVTFPARPARYVKVVAKNYGMIPDGQPGAGNRAWLFTDEIEVLQK